MTAEKFSSFLRSRNLDHLSGGARAKALQELAEHLNALAREERQRARIDREVRTWFEKMTEQEKEQFLEATLPTGFRQMLAAFEELPAERRRKALDVAERPGMADGVPGPRGADGGAR
jgi:nicotinic acid phosphoribosyltransferase